MSQDSQRRRPGDAHHVSRSAEPSLKDLYVSVWRRQLDLNGRAGRREFWSFALTNFVVWLIASAWVNMSGQQNTALSWISPILLIALVVPTFAVTVRRLHDRDMSGWMLWLYLFPLVGGLLILVLMLLPGTPGANSFGPQPGANALPRPARPPDLTEPTAPAAPAAPAEVGSPTEVARRDLEYAILIGLGVLGVVALLAGGKGLHTFATNREPTPVTCAEYYEDTSDAPWVRLTDCQVEWDDSVYLSPWYDAASSRVFYLPVVPPGFRGTPRLIVRSTDGVQPNLGETQDFVGMQEHWLERFLDRDRDPILRPGLADAMPRLDPNYVVVRDNEKPSVIVPTVLFIIGLLLIFFARRDLARDEIDDIKPAS